MTFPTPPIPPAYGPAKPQKLSRVTVPLIIQMVLSALGIVALPFLLPLMKLMMSGPTYFQDSGASPSGMQAMLVFLSASIWIVEAIAIAFLVLYFLTFRALQQGKSWGWTAAIVISILGLFNFPFGTALGNFGLVGAFDAEVTAYCNG